MLQTTCMQLTAGNVGMGGSRVKGGWGEGLGNRGDGWVQQWEISIRGDDRVLLGWPVELLDVTIQVTTIQPDVCDDVVLVVQVQVAQQGGNGALSWHCHAQRIAALWMRRVERLHHII